MNVSDRIEDIINEVEDHTYLYIDTDEFIASINGKVHIDSAKSLPADGSIEDAFYDMFGINPSTSKKLRTLYPDLLNDMISKVANRKGINEIKVLTNNHFILEIVPTDDLSVLHPQFIKTVVRELEDYFDIEGIVLDSVSNKILYMLVLQRTREDQDFRLGYLIINDEVRGTFARIAVLYKGILVAIPPKYGRYSAGKYMKTSDSYLQAIEMMMLRMKEDAIGDRFTSILGSCHMVFSDDTLLTCEEYTRLLEYLSISFLSNGKDFDIDDYRVRDELSEKYGVDIDEVFKKYLWRCTAETDYTLRGLIERVSKLVDTGLYYDPVLMIDSGHLIFSERLLNEVAKLKG